MKIGDRIKSERKKRNISQQQLANHLNISRQAVSRWENNISLPDLNTIVLIAKYFDIKLDYFTDDIIVDNTKELKEEAEKIDVKEQAIKEATPYILVLTVIITTIFLLPSKVKVPILFFGSLFTIFFASCLLIYYIIKNYLSRK
ncbi:MAG: helix-turn-helix domain-containing protein [Streptococcaceae bacterium]|nr:helix-turn-helix domain-containing protein [Streptococcaceae bacterium]